MYVQFVSMCRNETLKPIGFMFVFLFYRAISFAITGSQSSHLTIRKAIVKHMTTKTEELKSHVQNVEEHLGKMTTTSEWATDAELFAAASLLQTDIMLWLQRGDWALFGRNVLEKSCSLSDDKRVIYLQHTNSNHFDYIKGIM